MDQYQGELSPQQIQGRVSNAVNVKTWGQGTQMGEKLGFAMQFKVGDVVQLINVDNTRTCRGRIESSQDWGGYTVTILEGPRSGETITVAWNYVTPAMGMAAETKERNVARNLIREAVAKHPMYQRRMAELREQFSKEMNEESDKKPPLK